MSLSAAPAPSPAPGKAQEAVQALWRARALRYVLIYLLLGCVLVTLRYQTRDVYPQLRDLRDTRDRLQNEQNELSLTVQGLTGEQRIRAWALANGMLPYAQAPKVTQPFLPPVVASAPVQDRPRPATLTVRTVWK